MVNEYRVCQYGDVVSQCGGHNVTMYGVSRTEGENVESVRTTTERQNS